MQPEIDIEPTADRQLFSIGKTCELLQVSPDGLRFLMRAAGVRFVESRNDVPFIDGPTLDKIHEHAKAFLKSEER